MYVTGGIFISEKQEENSFCGGTIQVTVAFPKENDFDIDGYLTSRVDRYRSNKQLNELSIEELDNGQKGFRVNFSNQSVDPKGREHVTNNEHDIFEKEGRIIVTSFRSCDFFEQYYDVVQTAFASLTLKPIN